MLLIKIKALRSTAVLNSIFSLAVREARWPLDSGSRGPATETGDERRPNRRMSKFIKFLKILIFPSYGDKISPFHC